MKSILYLALATTVCGAPISVVRPIISDTDGGAALPASFDHAPGETLFFSCRVANYQKTQDEKVHLAYSVQAFDPKGVPLVELFRNEIVDEVTPQDKEWMPKIQTEVVLPALLASGSYRIEVKAEDLIAKTSTELSVPFQVRARDVPANDTLTVRNIAFFRSDDDKQPLEKAAYRTGDDVWMRFDITGFRYGAKNKVDVSYLVSIRNSEGKVLWTQPEPSAEQSDSFYPKPYVPASMSLNIQKGTPPGKYVIAVHVTDALGMQSYDTQGTFSVE